MHAIGAAQWRFRNWYSDDWAAQLYAERTYWLSDVEVDHGETKGPRYDVSYEHAFQFFRTAKFSMPAIDLAAISFDPTVAFGYIAALGHIDSLDAAELLEGARGLLVFSYALSILKWVVTVCAGALAAGEQLGVLPNVQFSECAHWDMMEKADGDGNRVPFGQDGVPEHIAGLDALVREAEGEAADQEAAPAGAGGRVHPQADDSEATEAPVPAPEN